MVLPGISEAADGSVKISSLVQNRISADIQGFGRIWRMPMTYVIDRQGVVRKDGSVGEPKIDLPLLAAVRGRAGGYATSCSRGTSAR